jgi:hypothetical protein
MIEVDKDYENRQKVLYAVLILSKGNTTFGVDQKEVQKLCEEYTLDKLREMAIKK